MQVGELFYKMGFKVDDKTLRPFDEGVKNLTSSFRTLSSVVGISGATYAIDKFLEKAAQAGGVLHDFREITGQSNEELRKWQIAASLSDVSLSTDDVTQSLYNLNSQLTDIKQNNAGQPNIFLRLGIDPTKTRDVFDVLTQLRETIKTMDRATFSNLIQRIGIDPRFVNVLEKSQEEFDKLVGNRGLGGSNIERLNEMGLKFKELQADVESFGLALAVKVSPYVEDFLGYAKRVGDDFERFGGQINYAAEQFPALKAAAELALGGLLIYFRPFTTLFAGFAWFFDKIESPEWQKNFYKFGGKLADAVDSTRGKDLLFGFLPPDRPAATGDKTNTVNSNNNTTVHISGAGDPQETFRVFQENIPRLTNGYAIDDFNNSVRK